MGIKELLLIEKLGSGIVSVTAALVLFLGLIVYASVMSGNPYADRGSLTENDRSPASVPFVAPQVQSVAQTVSKHEAEIIDLMCFNGSAPVTVKSSAKQIRLRGPACGANRFNKPEVVNRTNGFVATLFETEKRGISSDYIHLAPGENQILISFTDDRGERRMSELTISRNR